MDFGHQYTVAADSDSEAHSGPCYGGLGPASQPLSAPPQSLGGCADTLTSIFSKSPCAPVPADMHCARCVSLLGTPGLWIVCWVICNCFGHLLAVFFPPEGARG